MLTVDIACFDDGFYKLLNSNYYVEIRGITATLYKMYDAKTNSFEIVCSNIYLGKDWQNKLVKCDIKDKRVLY